MIFAGWLCAAVSFAAQALQLEVNPSGTVPLAIRCETTDNATVLVEVDAKTIRFRADSPPITLLGLKPATDYRISTDVDMASPIVLRTPALPEWFPPIRCTVAKPDRMEPGVTLLVVYRWIDSAIDRNFGLLVAVDERGEIIWHYRPDHAIHTVTMLDNGRLLYIGEREGTMYDIDFLGEVYRRWHTTGIPKSATLTPSVPVDTDTFHHDAIELPNGNLLTLSTELRTFANYPTSETDPHAPKQTANVIGDVIVEIDSTGAIVREHRLFDILDPYRIGYDSLGTFFWQRIYAARESWFTRDEWPRDWSHANSLHYNKADDSLLVSLYHQDAVIKLDRRSGELQWILGTPGGWREPWRTKCLTPVDGIAWPYHQHAAKLTPSGNVILFDNGKFRARPFDKPVPFGESYSRVVEYAIDETAGTVREVCSYEADFFSSFLGDVQSLPHTGNLLITDGGEVAMPDGTHAPMGFGKNWAQIMEVTREKKVVFKLELRDERPHVGWAVYRSMRIPWSVFAPHRVTP